MNKIAKITGGILGLLGLVLGGWCLASGDATNTAPVDVLLRFTYILFIAAVVILLGLAVIKSAANVRALRQNGPVLWVRRPIEKLATGGRPLSKGGAALKQLEEERTPLYQAAASAVLDNTTSLHAAVDAAAALFEADETL